MQPRLLRSGRRAPAWLSSFGPPAVRCSTRCSRPLWRRWRGRHFADGNPQFRAGPGDGEARPLWRSRRRRAGAFRRGHALWPKAVQAESATLIWSGPDQFLVLTRDGGDGALMEKLRQPFAGLASLTDQSHARAMVRIGGPQARAMLAKLSSIDLHPSAFPPGAAAATSIDHTSVNLWRGNDLADGRADFQPAGLRDLCREPVAHHTGRGGRIRRRCQARRKSLVYPLARRRAFRCEGAVECG